MSLLTPPSNAPAPPAPPAPPANPGNEPPANGGEGGGEVERPDWLPETAWKDGNVDLEGLKSAFEGAGKSADLPASADAYAMPAIEGFDSEKAASSPLFKALRTAAFNGGVGQAGFEAAVSEYVKEMTADANATEAAERAKLGQNADARLTTVSNWVSSSLPAEQAAALMAGATTADAIVALETLMNARAAPAPRDPPPAAKTLKTKEEIRALMQKPEYYDPKKRDPAVVKEVDDWYAAQGGKK